MKNIRLKLLGFACLAVLSGVLTWKVLDSQKDTLSTQELRAMRKADKKARKIARAEYWQQMLRDPKTGKIPSHAQAKALYYTQNYIKDAANARTEADVTLSWAGAGPDDIGGRIRAFAVDSRNSNVILAGGVTGGMWKSTNGAQSWTFKSDPNKNLGVSSIAQDPQNPDTWYYSTGEVGSSADAADADAPFLGAGLFKSTNNGDTWTFIGYEQGADNTEWKKAGSSLQFPVDKPKNPFYETSRLRISPTTGAIFVASNQFGILRSTDGGDNFKVVKVPQYTGTHYPDIVIDKNGNIIVSFMGIKDGDDGGGIFRSTDNGTTWTSITPTDFPDQFGRTVLALAPSNPNILYSLTTTGEVVNGFDEMYLYKHDLNAGTAENRAANIPTFPDANADYNGLKTQGNYNMVVAVHPTNENMVFIGGTSLFRSTDGFATKSTDINSVIGGYGSESAGTSNRFGDYLNHFPDQHLMFFDPNNPNIAFSMHDGGVSKTTDITAPKVSWTEMDNNFAITQFYRMAISSESGDYRMAGGCQDNSSLFMNWQKGQSFTPATIMQGGDGATAYIASDFIVVSAQNASINFYPTKADKTPDIDFQDGFITPEGLKNKQFVHPFVIDPIDENMMYLPDANEIWKNDKLKTKDGVEIFGSWSKMSGISARTGTTITTLAMSRQPAGILYFGAFDAEGTPQIFKVENAKSATTATEISVPNAPSGAYPVYIAVNPADANEILVVFANYNITGLYHSTNGGQSYTAIEGNLTGTTDLPGPSLRSASILNYDGKKVYYVGTSTGLYSTSNLNGAQTEWLQEGKQTIGSPVVVEVLTRDADGFVAVATHGRSNFAGLPTTDTQPQKPNAPVATAATNIGETELTANWNAVDGATSYELDVSTSSSFASFLAGYEAKSVTGTSEKITGLTENTEYFYRIRAKNSAGNSANSNVISAKTNAKQVEEPQKPNAPVATAATNIGETELTANWNAVDGATSYELDVSTSSSFASFLAGYEAKSVTGTSEKITGLTENTEYFYRIRAKNSAGNSANSNVISAKTNAQAVPQVATPVASNATNITETSFKANWQTAQNATQYTLEVSTSSNFTSLKVNETLTATSFEVTNLDENTTYFYRVKASNQDGSSVSEYSNTIQVKTLEATVSAIEDQKNLLGIRLYPNPVTDFIQLEIDKPQFRNTTLRCQIFDMGGKLILERAAVLEVLNQDLRTQTRTFAKGTYLIHIQADNIEYQQRFIKQ